MLLDASTAVFELNNTCGYKLLLSVIIWLLE
jgi:hypothetical protein